MLACMHACKEPGRAAFCCPGSPARASVHMVSMAKYLQAELRTLIARHLPPKGKEAQDILMDLALLLNDVEVVPVYQYRNHPKWDDTWMDLDEVQLEHVLKMGHTVERRPIAGGWELVTEVQA